MNNMLKSLDNLRRPRLLIRAARIGADEYCRDTHLRRLFGYGSLPHGTAVLARLIEMEEVLNQRRQSDRTRYSATRHVEILIAMMGEARLLRSVQPA